MAKHRKDGMIPDVLVSELYLGQPIPENIVGKIVMTENEKPVIIFDEQTVGRSVKKLLEPNGALPLSSTDDYEVYQLPAIVDLDKYAPQHNPTLF